MTAPPLHGSWLPLEEATDGTAGPCRGGTVHLTVPHGIPALDPVRVSHERSAPAVLARQLLWATTRQLLAYPSRASFADPARAFEPVADLAARGPTTANGDITTGGRRCTIRLRRRVYWHSMPHRQVVAADVVRGAERLARPDADRDLADAAAAVIAGFADCRAGRTRGISGVAALDPWTVRFDLLRPAAELLHLLACGHLVPVPVESTRQPAAEWPANGPYTVTRHGGRHLRLERNPDWDPATDPLRGQFLDAIDVFTNRSGAPTRIAAMPARNVWAGVGEVQPAVSEQPGERAVRAMAGYGWGAFLTVNLRADGPLQDPAVRRALWYAVDRVAVAGLLADAGELALPCADVLARPGEEGRYDPAFARHLLRAAGYPERLPLTLAVGADPVRRAVAECVADDLRRAGILGRVRRYTRRAPPHDDGWDLADGAWVPETPGGAALGALVHSAGARNAGGYRNPAVDRLIDTALTAGEPAATRLRARAARLVRADRPFVPLAVVAVRGPEPVTAALRNAVLMPALRALDLTAVWLPKP